mmetsp:Transcript_2550/g.7167  ORF Transcript_2550/g.7167 Transcript_2550/m.7167 type:complete len:221 (+) Transcript_2550:264-926(+)
MPRSKAPHARAKSGSEGAGRSRRRSLRPLPGGVARLGVPEVAELVLVAPVLLPGVGQLAAAARLAAGLAAAIHACHHHLQGHLHAAAAAAAAGRKAAAAPPASGDALAAVALAAALAARGQLLFGMSVGAGGPLVARALHVEPAQLGLEAARRGAAGRGASRGDHAHGGAHAGAEAHARVVRGRHIWRGILPSGPPPLGRGVLHASSCGSPHRTGAAAVP